MNPRTPPGYGPDIVVATAPVVVAVVTVVLLPNTPGSYCTVAARKMLRHVQVLEISSEMYYFVCVW